jgi:hypothetical protein
MVVSASTMFTTTNGKVNTTCHKKRVREYFVNIKAVYTHTHTKCVIAYMTVITMVHGVATVVHSHTVLKFV